MNPLNRRLSKLERRHDPGYYAIQVIIKVGTSEEDAERIVADAKKAARPDAGDREILVIQRRIVAPPPRIPEVPIPAPDHPEPATPARPFLAG